MDTSTSNVSEEAVNLAREAIDREATPTMSRDLVEIVCRDNYVRAGLAAAAPAVAAQALRDAADELEVDGGYLGADLRLRERADRLEGNHG